MVAETVAMEVVETHTEVEALLLERNLIKRLMPRYNVLLRDDKPFPYILLPSDHAIPQIAKHRGAHHRAGASIGHLASAHAFNRTTLTQARAFILRPSRHAPHAPPPRPR